MRDKEEDEFRHARTRRGQDGRHTEEGCCCDDVLRHVKYHGDRGSLDGPLLC